MHKNYKAVFLVILLIAVIVPNVKAISSEKELYVAAGMVVGEPLGMVIGIVSIIGVGYGLAWAGGYNVVSGRHNFAQSVLDEDVDLSEVPQNVKTIPREEALVISLSAGLVSSVVVGCGCYQIIKRAFNVKTPGGRLDNLYSSAALGILFGVSIGAVTLAELAEKKLSHVQRVQRWLKSVEKSTFIEPTFIDDQSFLLYVREHSGRDTTPFVAAHNNLKKLVESLQGADDILLLAGSDLDDKKGQDSLGKTRRRIHELLDLINQRMDFIEQQPEYAEELAHCGSDSGNVVEL